MRARQPDALRAPVEQAPVQAGHVGNQVADPVLVGLVHAGIIGSSRQPPIARGPAISGSIISVLIIPAIPDRRPRRPPHGDTRLNPAADA
ncbi:hypothetical protein E3D42_40735, partial [Burkholderia cepacia]